MKIEPEWYCPILPMVLVNGSDGIGTGYSTTIPNYNPREIVANLRRMMEGMEPAEMVRVVWTVCIAAFGKGRQTPMLLISYPSNHGIRTSLVQLPTLSPPSTWSMGPLLGSVPPALRSQSYQYAHGLRSTRRMSWR